jgi:ParB family chromosome partitioning protein
MAKPALGRGLGALMGGMTAGAKPPATGTPAQPVPARETAQNPPLAGGQVHRIPVGRVKPCPFQPRKDFSEESLKELADSIREQGILQPLVARARSGDYELIAGERRWRAAQIAGLTELPVIVREADDKQVLELALIENLQRQDLNPIEEALGFMQLIRDFSLTQEAAASRVGKSRATVANMLRLLQLVPEVQNYVRTNLLSFGHARAILGCAGGETQKQIAEAVIREGLSVRETEALVAAKNQAAHPANRSLATRPPGPPDIHAADIENKLQERFGTKVLLKYRKGKGSVEIRFFSDDDLERIMEIAGIKSE